MRKQQAQRGVPLTRDISGLAAGAARNSAGVALVTAIAGALLISVSAAALVGLAWRRFELTAMRTDRAVTLAATESGLQYVFARLDADPGFRDRVRVRRETAGPPAIQHDQWLDPPHAVNGTYIVGCHLTGLADRGIEYVGPTPIRERDDRMHMLYTEGSSDPNTGKHVRVRVRLLLRDAGRNPIDPIPAGRTHVMRSEAPKRQ